MGRALHEEAGFRIVPKNEPEEYLIPEIQVRVSAAWIRLIYFCQTEYPNGRIGFRINNGQPGEFDDKYSVRKRRFDKPGDVILPDGS